MSDGCPVDIGVARNEEYWKRVDALASSGNLRERQAAYRDWLDRERQRAALAGAACGKCVFWIRHKKSARGPDGSCHFSSSRRPHARKVQGYNPIDEYCMVHFMQGETYADDWCEHYLPRAEHDPRPEGGTP